MIEGQNLWILSICIFCILISLQIFLSLFSWDTFKLLEKVWSFQVLLLSFARWDENNIYSRVNFIYYWGRTLPCIPWYPVNYDGVYPGQWEWKLSVALHGLPDYPLWSFGRGAFPASGSSLTGTHWLVFCWILEGELCRSLEFFLCSVLLSDILPFELLPLAFPDSQLYPLNLGRMLGCAWISPPWKFSSSCCSLEVFSRQQAGSIIRLTFFAPFLLEITVVHFLISTALKNVSYILSHFSVVSVRRVNLAPVSPSWPIVKVSNVIIFICFWARMFRHREPFPYLLLVMWCNSSRIIWINAWFFVFITDFWIISWLSRIPQEWPLDLFLFLLWVSIWTHAFKNIWCVALCCRYYLFWYPNIFIWANGSLLSWLLCPFHVPLLVSDSFHAFLCDKGSRFILCTSCPQT